MKTVSASLRARLKKVRFLLLDVDGVLTDGRIVYDANGVDSRFYDVQDGLGVYLLGRMGIKTVLVTAKASPSLKPRARDMRVEAIFENILPKTRAYAKILKKYRLRDEDVCFMGDDLLDLAVMRRAGVSAAPRQAADDVKRAADYVTRKEGGRGAVREVADLILKCKGLWHRALKIYE
jgi:3-deoxy-D-manno-octulosonate 8-phosphate phosphatase (KDO 8-P phosphatase)